MGYTRAEMETTVTWDEAEKVARVYSASPVVRRKLDKLVSEFPDVYKRVWVENGNMAAKYEINNTKLIRFGKPASAARIEAGKRMALKMRSVSTK